MSYTPVVLGIDLGTTGVRIAVINTEGKLFYSSSIEYKKGLEEWNDWKQCCSKLLKEIPKKIKNDLSACAVAGTSGTLLACNFKGKPIANALPYHLSCPEQKPKLAELFPNGGPGSSTHSSVARALRLIDQYGSELILRHQADWITGWLSNNWIYGEESNNLRLGWDLKNKSWPSTFNHLKWIQALPKVIPSGSSISTISSSLSKEFELPQDLKIIAGTTDSNAGVLATFARGNEGVTILGSTIVLKQFVDKPIQAKGISNHYLMGKWLCGGASNAGGSVLKKFFNDEDIEELSRQINVDKETGLNLLPLPSKGDRFPIEDPNLQPVLGPRPISDSMYLHALFEGLARVEAKGWRRLEQIGAPIPTKIITIGGGAKNTIWKKIREKYIKIPIRTCINPAAIGAGRIALNAIRTT